MTSSTSQDRSGIATELPIQSGSSAEREFLHWLSSLDQTSLTAEKHRLISVIRRHFAALEATGTHGGGRAKLLLQLLDSSPHAEVVPETTSAAPATGARMVTRLQRLTVGRFRGFDTSQEIVLDRDYIFVHGPNGSGKSSLCQAFEYTLTGGLQEAEARGFKAPRFIRNSRSSSVPAIELTAKFTDGTEGPIGADWRYRFCFIESNRIDDFARLPAASQAVQRERLAALFGLGEFSRFVDGFTADLSKYLDQHNPQEPLLNKLDQQLKQLSSQLEEKRSARERALREAQDLCVRAGHQTTASDTKGVLRLLAELTSRLEDDAKKPNPPPLIDLSVADAALSAVDVLAASIEEQTKLQCKLENARSKISYKRLYDALEALAVDSADRCPACLTPVSMTVKNPFEEARKGLANLKEVTEGQEQLEEKGHEVRAHVVNLVSQIAALCNGLKNIHTPEVADNAFSWDRVATPTIRELEEVTRYCTLAKQEIIAHNSKISDPELGKSVGVALEAATLHERLASASREAEHLEAQVSEVGDRRATVYVAHEQRLAEIESGARLISEYRSLIEELQTYRDELPSQLAANLSERTLAFFNHIKTNHPRRQTLDKLNLPATANAPITLAFADDARELDALHVLSEGNLKCLGVCILLAKAVTEDLSFIVFDDIVNAMDDDHRNGVASLLLENENLSERQLLVTCHGQLFIDKLVQILGPRRSEENVRRYFLKPPEMTGGAVAIGGSSVGHYLQSARAHLIEGNLVNAEADCRMALEQQMWSLWKKIYKETGEQISLGIRYGEPPPIGLADLAIALTSKLQGIKDRDGAERPLVAELKQLQESYSWSLLNKATHRTPELPELEVIDVESAIALIEVIEQGVQRIKFEVFSRPKGGRSLKGVQ